MNNWSWAFGTVPLVPKFLWAVIGGDQKPHSPDDQECGDHFIEKNLECHDGDAHRPTPGQNPYFQGDRKGPEDKSKDTGDRDKGEVTPKAKERKEVREKEGMEPVNFAEERFDHYADQLERAWEEKTGKPLVWNDKRLHEMIEMVMRDTAREYSLDSEELGFQELGIDYYGPEDSPLEPFRAAPKKGYKGRSLWRPRTFEKPTTTPRDDGGMESVPPGFRSELGKGLIQKIRERKGAERGVESDLNWSGSKIMMDRAEQPVKPGCPSEGDLLALHNSLPSLPGDSAESRPCEEGEDPKKGHCKENGISRPQQQRPMSDDPKVLRKMGGKPPTPPKGVGVDPGEDPKRRQRTAQQTHILKNSDPKDSKRTAWAVGKMFGGTALKQTDKGLAGSSKPMNQKQAKTQYDDARHSMKQAGWQNTSDMGNSSTWNKGGANVSMQMGKGPQSGTFTNQFIVHMPKAKKRGLFGNTIMSKLIFALNWGYTQSTLADRIHWTEARPCTEGDEDSQYGPHGDDQKCVDEGGEGYEESSDVPEGFQEVDLGAPGPDPEGGDWEEVLETEPKKEQSLKRTMKEEEREGKKLQQEEEKQAKLDERTATQIPRDPSLGPDDYHQFWSRDDWHVQKAREILEQRGARARTPEEAEAVKRLLMNGPKVGGGYEKAGKLQPGMPSSEDIIEPERDKSPVGP